MSEPTRICVRVDVPTAATARRVRCSSDAATATVDAIKKSKAEADRLAEINDEWDVYDCANKLSEAVRRDIDLIMNDYK